MKPFHVCSEPQKDDLYLCLETISPNPYTRYVAFRDAVSACIDAGQVPSFFVDVCRRIRHDRKENSNYAHLLRNLPLDPVKPVFDQNDPVADKYTKKTKFISESLLELFSQLTGIPLLAYETRNNGDFFHDVYVDNRYSGTQTQKSDSELFFHNDRTAHEVRADYLVLLAMRCHPENRIYTGHIDGRDLLEQLPPETRDTLRRPYFLTPFDEYSRDSNASQTLSDPHVILENEHSFRYYDTRTIVAPEAPVAAKDALLVLKNAILKARKHRVHLVVGDLICFPNQDSLHNRDMVELSDPENARLRWLLKTYNFRDRETMEYYRSHFGDVPGFVREPEPSTGAFGQETCHD